MSLRLKYLLPLNLIILVVWVGHAWWNLSVFEEEFIRAETEAIEHLALGFKYHIEHSLWQGEDISHEQKFLEELASRRSDLDIMVVDSKYTVLLSSAQGRIGKKWTEKSIEKVMTGADAVLWNIYDHTHDQRRAIDVSIAAQDAKGRIRFVIHVAKWLDNLLTALWKQRFNHIVSAVLLLIIVALGVNLLTYKLVLHPLSSINQEIEQSGWHTEHLQHGRADEVVRLHHVVSIMLDRIKKQTDNFKDTIAEKQHILSEVSAIKDDLADQVVQVSGELKDAQKRLIRAERLVALGQLSAALAHELRNPLHIVRGAAETAARQYPAVAKLAGNISEEVDRVEKLIKELLNYTRTVEIQRGSVDVAAMLESARNRLCRGLCNTSPEDCAACVVTVDDTVREIEADPVLLEQAVMNLLTNAREMSPEGSRIDISARNDDAGDLIISVADRGPGISDEDLPRVFEPFFTQKSHGIGFGLPIVEKIADLHGGSVLLEHRTGGGTIARLRIPKGEKGRMS